MPLPEAKFVDVLGIRTRYFEAGSGAPLVLLHGGNFGGILSADCAANFDRNIEGLSSCARVIAVDRLGQGLTDNPVRLQDYTMTTVVAHVAAFLTTLGLKDVILAGHSRGGYVACRTTLDYPDLIRSCILIDSGTLAPGPSGMEAVMTDVPEPRLTRDAQRWVLERYSFNRNHIDDAWLDALTEVAATSKYRDTIATLPRAPFFSHLARHKEETLALLGERGIGKPVLVLWGLNDPTATIERGHDLFRLIASRQSNAEMHVFNQAGHFVYRERPEEFNSVILNWMSRCA